MTGPRSPAGDTEPRHGAGAARWREQASGGTWYLTNHLVCAGSTGKAFLRANALTPLGRGAVRVSQRGPPPASPSLAHLARQATPQGGRAGSSAANGVGCHTRSPRIPWLKARGSVNHALHPLLTGTRYSNSDGPLSKTKTKTGLLVPHLRHSS